MARVLYPTTQRIGPIGMLGRLLSARALFRRSPLGAVIMFGIPAVRWYLRRRADRRRLDAPTR